MVVDWTGTNPQVKGAINNTLSFTKAASYTGVRSVLPPGIPNNEGVFRAIEVICPPGTVGNGVLPAACAARGLTGFRMVDCMFGALAMMLPDKVKAAGDGGNTGISIGGYDAERKPFIYVDFTCGAWGARPWADGLDGNSHMFANMASHSIEVTEAEQPIAARWPTSSSPTRPAPASIRGGVPFRRDYRFLEDEGDAAGALRPARPSAVRPLWRQPGRSRRRTISTPTARTALLPSKLTMTIKQGRRVPPRAGRRRRLGRSAGARSRGGAARRAQRVAVAAKALADYGVVVDTAAWAVDAAATATPSRRNPPGARLDARRPRCSGTSLHCCAAPRSETDGQSPIASASTSAAPSPTSCCSAPTAPSIPRRSRPASATTPRRSSTGLSEVFSETGLAGAAIERDPPRHHRRLQRHPRAQGRARRADHHQGLPRRAGDPHAAHAASSTTSAGPSPRRWSSATCARSSTSASTIAAMSSARSIRPTPSAPSMRCWPRRSRRSPSACCNSFANPGARADAEGDRRAQGPAPAAEHLLRGAARDQGVRAHLDDGDQRLRHADRRHLSARAAQGPRRGRHSGPPAADAVERRADHRCAPRPSGR